MIVCVLGKGLAKKYTIYLIIVDDLRVENGKTGNLITEITP